MNPPDLDAGMELGFRDEFHYTLQRLERFARDMFRGPVAPSFDASRLRQWLDSVDFERPTTLQASLDAVLEQFQAANVHTVHPGYFGLFNPAPVPWGEIADVVAARLNPQLAVWSHAPAAVEIEECVLRFMAGRLHLPQAAGFFTSGGEEANRCGVYVALVRCFPGYAEHGLIGTHARPVLYVSAESHLAWIKIAAMLGLGRSTVRLVPVDHAFRLDVEALRNMIDQDRCGGFHPFFVGATAGTTAAGAIDPLREIAGVARTMGLHFHVDAAWAGAVALCNEWRHLLTGLEDADSVAVDAHKWLSQPMGTGMFFCREPDALRAAFGVRAAYMPEPTEGRRDFYRTSPMWSRRWIGLRLFLSLAVAGRGFFDAQMRRDIELGKFLRHSLAGAGWRIVNDTPLPLVCFTDAASARSPAWHEHVAACVVQSGTAWISTVRLAGNCALRACITNWRTQRNNVERLVLCLEEARRRPPDGRRATASGG